MLEWTIQLPEDASLTDLAASLTAAGAEATRLAGGSLRTVDPWGTAIRIGTRPSLDADAA